MSQKLPYAHVAPNVPIDSLFTYRIPGHFSSQIQPGVRVIINFGNKILTGVVIELSDKVQYFIKDKTPVIYGAGGCDLRIPIKYGETPAVLFGPSGGMLHSVDEYVNFEEVISVTKVLTAFIIDWCGIV